MKRIVLAVVLGSSGTVIAAGQKAASPPAPVPSASPVATRPAPVVPADAAAALEKALAMYSEGAAHTSPF
ncbi:MAG TPA: hypothetical protein VFW15_09755, partial [Thermoanaerobaculia bacterium]|nr:hypothetical protein [Thermoanaerobaculia bacterium]